jgi:nitrite reductase/ring-hydroxylating ferredoxin subunit
MVQAKRRLRLCAAGDIESGGMISVDIAEMPRLVVYRIGEEFYCSQDECTHGAASLRDDGDLDGYIIECGLHSGKFDIRTGEPCAPPCTEALRTFPIIRDGGELFIEVA